MVLRLGDDAPNFTAESTEGEINLYDYLGDSWGILFSHPKDFTPVCTTELGYMAKIKPEFDKRNVKILGLSVDPLDRHKGWADDIEETQGAAPNYPLIADSDFNVAKLYDMLPAAVSGDPDAAHAGRQHDGAQRLRDRARQEAEADPRVPDVDGPQLRRGAARHRLAAAHGELQRLDAGQLEGRRRRHHRSRDLATKTPRRSSRRAGRPSSHTCA